jgi:hypothetical protein
VFKNTHIRTTFRTRERRIFFKPLWAGWGKLMTAGWILTAITLKMSEIDIVTPGIGLGITSWAKGIIFNGI